MVSPRHALDLRIKRDESFSDVSVHSEGLEPQSYHRQNTGESRGGLGGVNILRNRRPDRDAGNELRANSVRTEFNRDISAS
jgi:hypothetical protein